MSSCEPPDKQADLSRTVASGGRGCCSRGIVIRLKERLQHVPQKGPPLSGHISMFWPNGCSCSGRVLALTLYFRCGRGEGGSGRAAVEGLTTRGSDDHADSLTSLPLPEYLDAVD